jgi:hypothetical protein
MSRLCIGSSTFYGGSGIKVPGWRSRAARGRLLVHTLVGCSARYAARVAWCNPGSARVSRDSGDTGRHLEAYSGGGNFVVTSVC